MLPYIDCDELDKIVMNKHEVYLTVIDGCEYIVYCDKDNNEHITHKGNCRMCMHNLNVIIKTIENNSK